MDPSCGCRVCPTHVLDRQRSSCMMTAPHTSPSPLSSRRAPAVPGVGTRDADGAVIGGTIGPDSSLPQAPQLEHITWPEERITLPSACHMKSLSPHPHPGPRVGISPTIPGPSWAAWMRSARPASG